MEKIKVASKQVKCPICTAIMVEIHYGMPNLKMTKEAKQRKIFIGGCILSDDSPIYHCYNCRKSFCADLKTNIDEDDDWLQK